LACLAILCFAACKKEDQKAIDDQLILDHIAANAALSTAEATASGLYYVIEDSGTTDHPGITQTVSVYYRGTLLDGTQFDAVQSPSAPLDLPLAYTILGWQEGIPMFGRGGKGVLLIPSHLGYGEDGAGSIPKNAVLKFEIELFDFY
jgi:FKBP-type peptidyl-prolyl cis-trans isomerase FkpA